MGAANERQCHGIFVAMGSDGPGYGLLDLAQIINDGIGEKVMTFESPPEADSGGRPLCQPELRHLPPDN